MSIKQGFGSGFNGFVDPDPDQGPKNEGKIYLLVNFISFFKSSVVELDPHWIWIQ
jgi:hypothetical protein